eukprot:SAG11_NODE_239_length_11783_cov_52.724923_2_plen_319_part_00
MQGELGGAARLRRCCFGAAGGGPITADGAVRRLQVSPCVADSGRVSPLCLCLRNRPIPPPATTSAERYRSQPQRRRLASHAGPAQVVAGKVPGRPGGPGLGGRAAARRCPLSHLAARTPPREAPPSRHRGAPSLCAAGDWARAAVGLARGGSPGTYTLFLGDFNFEPPQARPPAAQPRAAHPARPTARPTAEAAAAAQGRALRGRALCGGPPAAGRLRRSGHTPRQRDARVAKDDHRGYLCWLEAEKSAARRAPGAGRAGRGGAAGRALRPARRPRLRLPHQHQPAGRPARARRPVRPHPPAPPHALGRPYAGRMYGF